MSKKLWREIQPRRHFLFGWCPMGNQQRRRFSSNVTRIGRGHCSRWVQHNDGNDPYEHTHDRGAHWHGRKRKRYRTTRASHSFLSTWFGRWNVLGRGHTIGRRGRLVAKFYQQCVDAAPSPYNGSAVTWAQINFDRFKRGSNNRTGIDCSITGTRNAAGEQFKVAM